MFQKNVLPPYFGQRQALYSATSQKMMTDNQYISLCNKKSILILTEVSMGYG